MYRICDSRRRLRVGYSGPLCKLFQYSYFRIAECFILGMYAKPVNLAGEINRYTGKFKMPARPLVFSLKYLSPVALSCLTMWGVYHLIFVNGGLYGGYPLWMQAVFGWALSIIVFASGFIICGFVSPKMRRKQQRLRRFRRINSETGRLLEKKNSLFEKYYLI